jgi:hypothetical protein
MTNATYNQGIFSGHMISEETRPRRRSFAGGVDIVLDGNDHPVQWTTPGALGASSVTRIRIFTRFIREY